jgi:hypothetical protein
MTPEEKARELINKMNNVDLNCDNESMCMLYPHALECALIVVDEMLAIIHNVYGIDEGEIFWDGYGIDEGEIFLNEVKKEIIKLK